MSQKAQQTIEFATLIALIAAGIMLGGPYVIRSWNAHVKSIEQGVADSFHDPLLEAPPGTPLPDCNCGAWVLDDFCGGESCAETQRLEKRECEPEGCEAFHPEYRTEDCFADPSCCTLAGPYAEEPQYCGLNVCKDIPLKFADADDPTLWQATLTDDCAANPEFDRGGGEKGCRDGWILQYKLCGRADDPLADPPTDPTPHFSCVENLSVCGFYCNPADIDTTLATKCKDLLGAGGFPVDPDDETGLTEITDRNFVHTCTAAKCEAVCCPGYCTEEDRIFCTDPDRTPAKRCVADGQPEVPLYCNADGNLVYDCGHCPCPYPGWHCSDSGDRCIENTECSDGTPMGQCSLRKPLFCDRGELKHGCGPPRNCGCPDDILGKGYYECQADGSCDFIFGDPI